MKALIPSSKLGNALYEPPLQPGDPFMPPTLLHCFNKVEQFHLHPVSCKTMATAKYGSIPSSVAYLAKLSPFPANVEFNERFSFATNSSYERLAPEDAVNSFRVDFDCDIYVTLRPCNMCLYALAEARISNVYYLLDSDYDKNLNSNFNNINISSIDDIYEYSSLIKDFFKNLRDKNDVSRET